MIKSNYHGISVICLNFEILSYLSTQKNTKTQKWKVKRHKTVKPKIFQMNQHSNIKEED